MLTSIKVDTGYFNASLIVQYLFPLYEQTTLRPKVLHEIANKGPLNMHLAFAEAKIA